MKESQKNLSKTISEKTNAADQKKLLVIVGCSSLAAALLLAVIVGGWWQWRRRKANTQGNELNEMNIDEEASVEDGTETSQVCTTQIQQ